MKIILRKEHKYISVEGTGEQFQQRHAKKRQMLNMQTTVQGQS